MKQTLQKIQKTENIAQDHFESLKLRLESIGFTPGTEIEVLKKMSFEQVIVVRIYQTVIALNKVEFSCLKFSI